MISNVLKLSINCPIVKILKKATFSPKTKISTEAVACEWFAVASKQP